MLPDITGTCLHDAKSMVSENFQEFQDKMSGGPLTRPDTMSNIDSNQCSRPGMDENHNFCQKHQSPSNVLN